VLTGCVIQDDNKYAAFVENAQTGVTLKVSPGDAIATGKVTNIGFDFLEYETAGQLTRMEIGHNFTGSVASLAERDGRPADHRADHRAGGSVESKHGREAEAPPLLELNGGK
jgi:hypothetical protein